MANPAVAGPLEAVVAAAVVAAALLQTGGGIRDGKALEDVDRVDLQ